MNEKPIVKCMIARPLTHGRIGQSRVVSLGTAYLALRAGFTVVGPDPDDLEALAIWEQAHRPTINHPRMVR